jgi:uncharacterized DUF497 family protein
VKFEWDPGEDESNGKKHGLSFREASTVFDDPLARTVPDPRHSEDEFRFVTVGYTSAGRLVVVAHTDREERTRIITAREAKPSERRNYESET